MDSARSDLSARRPRQVGSSARRLRQVGWSARRLRQEPFDGPQARMKCHWRAFFELAQLNAESLRQVAIMPQDAYTIRATQNCSKLGTTMGWKWFSRICEGERQVEPDPSVHNPPCRRLHHWRHHQRNFMIAYFQIHNNRSSSCVTNKTVRLHRLTHEREIIVESYGFVSYAQQALGTRPCRQRHDILRKTLCGCKPHSS